MEEGNFLDFVEGNSLGGAEDKFVEDSFLKGVDNSSDGVEDNFSEGFKDNSFVKVEDNSFVKVEDNSFVKVEDNSFVKVEDNSFERDEDNSFVKVEDNSLERVEDSLLKVSAYDSDSEVEGKKKHLKTATSSDEEDDEKPSKPKVATDDLFGDADDISDESDVENKSKKHEEDEDNCAKGFDVTRGKDGEEEAGGSPWPFIDEEDKEAPREELPETRIDLEIPKITADLGKELNFVKLPNFLSVETRPFDPQTYEDEIDEDEVLDEEGRARLKLKVENTLRWRWGFDKDQNPVRESNARIVRWSDGSMSLHLGSEIFDIHKQNLQRDHNHLFIRQGTGLQGQAVFRTKLTFRPHSTDSFTHRKITISVADRSRKIQKIRVLPNVGQDPEAHRSEMIKKEEDRLKASIRRESKQRRMKEHSQTRGLSSSYLEPDHYDDDDDDDESAISLAAIKNKYKKGLAKADSRPSIYSSDSDASDIEDRRARRLEKAKALADSDEEENESSDIEESEPRKKTARIEESEEEEDL